MMEVVGGYNFEKSILNSSKIDEESVKAVENIPKNIGPYEIICKIKDGSFSIIYLAKSRYTGEYVAIKAFDKKRFQESIDDLLIMIKQTEVLKLLKHRNILSLFGMYESPKYFYLITEYLPNNCLIEKIIKQKRFSEEEALKIFYQLVDALYYMHSTMNICHRNISVENIFFDKNNRVKLIGFSYSTFYKKNQKFKESFGSLCYACPEIISEEEYDPELADVWSLGIVLYVIVCGYLPFCEEDDEKNKDLIVNGKIDYPKEMSNKLKDLLNHMLDINPKKRYTFSKIVKHPWFRPFNESLLLGGCNTFKMIYPTDEKVLNILVIYGFNRKEIDMDLKQNKFNNGTGVYFQLVRKLLNMGLSCVSDLCSKDYITFRDDKDNYFTNGDKKYEKNLNKIEEKIKDVEKYIESYRIKEDSIISSLGNLYQEYKMKEIEEQKKIQEENEIRKNISTKQNLGAKKKNTKTNDLIGKHRRTLTPVISGSDPNIFNCINCIGQIHKPKKSLIQKIKLEINGTANALNQSIIIEENKRSFSNPNLKDFVKKLIKETDNEDIDIIEVNNNDNIIENNNKHVKFNINQQNNNKNMASNRPKLLKSFRRVKTFSIPARKKKTYLNNSSFMDNYLKKQNPENLKKAESLISIDYNNNTTLNDISNINNTVGNHLNNIELSNIITNDNNNENNNENNENSENNENNENELKTKKMLNLSLSFGDDDEDDEENNESSYISKIDIKQNSIYEIEEELKYIKEIKNNIKTEGSFNNTILTKKNSNNINNTNSENNEPGEGIFNRNGNIFRLSIIKNNNEIKNNKYKLGLNQSNNINNISVKKKNSPVSPNISNEIKLESSDDIDQKTIIKKLSSSLRDEIYLTLFNLDIVINKKINWINEIKFLEEENTIDYIEDKRKIIYNRIFYEGGDELKSTKLFLTEKPNNNNLIKYIELKRLEKIKKSKKNNDNITEILNIESKTNNNSKMNTNETKPDNNNNLIIKNENNITCFLHKKQKYSNRNTNDTNFYNNINNIIFNTNNNTINNSLISNKIEYNEYYNQHNVTMNNYFTNNIDNNNHVINTDQIFNSNIKDEDSIDAGKTIKNNNKIVLAKKKLANKLKEEIAKQNNKKLKRFIPLSSQSKKNRIPKNSSTENLTNKPNLSKKKLIKKKKASCLNILEDKYNNILKEENFIKKLVKMQKEAITAASENNCPNMQRKNKSIKKRKVNNDLSANNMTFEKYLKERYDVLSNKYKDKKNESYTDIDFGKNKIKNINKKVK